MAAAQHSYAKRMHAPAGLARTRFGQFEKSHLSSRALARVRAGRAGKLAPPLALIASDVLIRLASQRTSERVRSFTTGAATRTGTVPLNHRNAGKYARGRDRARSHALSSRRSRLTLYRTRTRDTRAREQGIFRCVGNKRKRFFP